MLSLPLYLFLPSFTCRTTNQALCLPIEHRINIARLFFSCLVCRIVLLSIFINKHINTRAHPHTHTHTPRQSLFATQKLINKCMAKNKNNSRKDYQRKQRRTTAKQMGKTEKRKQKTEIITRQTRRKTRTRRSGTKKAEGGGGGGGKKLQINK